MYYYQINAYKANQVETCLVCLKCYILKQDVVIQTVNKRKGKFPMTKKEHDCYIYKSCYM